MDENEYFQLAADEAKLATCLRARCGTVIIARNAQVIGRGHNSPPLEDEGQRTCNLEWDLSVKPKYDKTCCIHAEWNAVIDACKTNAQKLIGSTLYFMRVDENGDFTDAGDPFCTVCSRLSLQSGIEYFALWNSTGIQRYSTRDYNLKSYDFFKLNPAD